MSESSAGKGAFIWTPGGEGVATPGAPPAARRPVAQGPRERVQRAVPAALPPDSELWDVHAAARFLGRSVSWVYHKAEDGTLPARRLGGWGIRFIPAELRAWVACDGRGAR